jgi:hypothetical protein
MDPKTLPDRVKAALLPTKLAGYVIVSGN